MKRRSACMFGFALAACGDSDLEPVTAPTSGIASLTAASMTGPPTGATGADNFDQWYRDVEGINLDLPIQLSLTDEGDGTYTFDSTEFFPIDDQGFGNEGNTHNYHRFHRRRFVPKPPS